MRPLDIRIAPPSQNEEELRIRLPLVTVMLPDAIDIAPPCPACIALEFTIELPAVTMMCPWLMKAAPPNFEDTESCHSTQGQRMRMRRKRVGGA
eukprot:6425352-Prymnesium_polylepis.2